MPHHNTNEYYGDKTSMNRLMNLINKIVDENGIDRNRISIWEFSLGANQLPNVVKQYPDFFSSAILISCNSPNYAESFKNLPTYIFQGDNDPHGNLRITLYNNINKIGEKTYKKNILISPI